MPRPQPVGAAFSRTRGKTTAQHQTPPARTPWPLPAPAPAPEAPGESHGKTLLAAIVIVALLACALLWWLWPQGPEKTMNRTALVPSRVKTYTPPPPLKLPESPEVAAAPSSSENVEKTAALPSSPGKTVTGNQPPSVETPLEQAVQGNPAPEKPQATIVLKIETDDFTLLIERPRITAVHQPQNAMPSQRLTSLTQEIIHIVVRGDTLWHIAKRYLHNPLRYPELAELSRIRNPHLIYPGDRVRIIPKTRD